MIIGIGIFIILLGVVLYFLLFHEPVPDMVFRSSSDNEINVVQKYLSENGIKTYVKNKDIRQLHSIYADIIDPSLHVLDPNEYKKAILLIQSYERQRTQTK